MSLSWLPYIAAALALTLTPVFLLFTGAFLWASSARYVKKTNFKLDHSPNDVTRLELFRLVVLLLSKTLLPGYSVKLKKGKGVDTFQLPQLQVGGMLSIRPQHVTAFQKAMTLEGSDSHINPFFLFTQVNPVVVLLLSHPLCPIKPLGSVNMRNEFRFVKPATCCDIRRLTTAAKEGQLTYVASLQEKANRRKRGIEFSIRITLTITDQDILVLDMWFMQFLAKSFMPLSTVAQTPETSPWNRDLARRGRREQSLKLNTSDPKLWADSCKDYNPIHISSVGARLFGFKGVIAHGNHVVALAVQQQLAKHTSLLHGPFSQDSNQIKLTMQFLRPVILPSEVTPIWAETKADLEEYVLCGRSEAEHVRGKLSISSQTSE